MFLLFLVAGLTVTGALVGTAARLTLLPHTSSPQWLVKVLLYSFLGGVVGGGIGMLLLGFRGLIRWESREHAEEKARRR